MNTQCHTTSLLTTFVYVIHNILSQLSSVESIRVLGHSSEGLSQLRQEDDVTFLDWLAIPKVRISV